jgi:hypothetical protein
MTAAAARGEEVMTDFQFRALISLVLSIVDKSKDLDEVREALKLLALPKRGR